MSNYTAPPAERLFLAHRLEANSVIETERALYRANTEYVGDLGNPELSEDSAFMNIALDELDRKYYAHKCAHTALALGLARNMREFKANEQRYMQEALEDALEQGYDINGWSIED